MMKMNYVFSSSSSYLYPSSSFFSGVKIPTMMMKSYLSVTKSLRRMNWN